MAQTTNASSPESKRSKEDKRAIAIIIAILLFLLLFILMCLKLKDAMPKKTKTNDLDIAEGVDIETPYREAVIETISIPGFYDMTITEQNPELNLTNPEGNTVYLVYRISNGDDVIYESQAIPPGKMLTPDIRELLSPGSYSLTFDVMTYDTETQAECNGTSQTVNVTVS
jgi:hypothetical protein